MKKILLLSVVIALSAPLTAHALITNDEVLSYAAMPLAVSDVCDVRGVQTDEVSTLVTYMDRANVSPEAFVSVFRYVPVALTFNSGDRADFVQWVGSEVDQGITGDQLVTVMQRRLATYGNTTAVASYHRHRRHRHGRYYASAGYGYAPPYPVPYYAAYSPYAAFDAYYVPAGVVQYVDYELLDPFALIDVPVAVANVVDIGVPIGRVGGLMVQLDLGFVSPVETVEILRYAPTALVAVNYGAPDFVQFVYDQRIGGVTGFGLVAAIDQQFPVYGVTPQLDLAAPVYVGQTAWVPSVVNNYVAPVDPAWVPQTVRTQVASFAAGNTTWTPQTMSPAGTAVAPAQVQRLLSQQGNAVVTNPGQAHRELAQSMRAGGTAAAMAGAMAAGQMARGRMGRGQMAAAPGGLARAAVASQRGRAFARQQVTTVRGNGRRIATRGRAPTVLGSPPGRPSFAGRGVARAEHGRPQFIQQRARPQFSRPVMAAPRPQFAPRPAMAMPRGNGGGRPAQVMAPRAAPAPQAQPARGNGNGQGKKGKG